MSFHPYLFFQGNCREAFTQYQEIFGGELYLTEVKDAPADQQPPGAQADLILHASLTVDGDLLMGSDDPSDGAGSVQGMMVAVSVKNVDEAKRVFEALSDRGEVRLPIGETFWSPMFGMCVDRFGTPWMVDTDRPNTT